VGGKGEEGWDWSMTPPRVEIDEGGGAAVEVVMERRGGLDFIRPGGVVSEVAVVTNESVLRRCICSREGWWWDWINISSLRLIGQGGVSRFD